MNGKIDRKNRTGYIHAPQLDIVILHRCARRGDDRRVIWGERASGATRRDFRPAPLPSRRQHLRAPNTSTTTSARPVSCCSERAMGFGGTRSKIRPNPCKPNPNTLGKYGLWFSASRCALLQSFRLQLPTLHLPLLTEAARCTQSRLWPPSHPSLPPS